MADTQVSSLAAAGTTAFDKRYYYALRPQLHFDQVATVKGEPTHRGGSVQFTITDDLAAATTALTETSDVTAVAMSDSTVTVTLVEYGNTIRTTAKARGTDYFELDAQAANVLGHNAGISIDTLARTELTGGTNVVRPNDRASTAALVAGDVFGAADVREIVAGLRGANSMPFTGSNYLGMIHPDQSVDLRSETGAAGWLEPANHSEAARRWNGFIGTFEGVMWIETPRVELDADAGSGTVDAYYAVVVGQECLAKAFSTNESAPLPTVRRGPVTDSLMRFHPTGWYWLGGYKRFREASIQRYETASSIGAN